MFLLLSDTVEFGIIRKMQRRLLVYVSHDWGHLTTCTALVNYALGDLKAWNKHYR